MSENSKIEWTDHTFNPWWGCQKVSEGCKHCYAEALDNRWKGALFTDVMKLIKAKAKGVKPAAPTLRVVHKKGKEDLLTQLKASLQGSKRRVS